MNRFSSKTYEDESKATRFFRFIPLIMGILIILIFMYGVNYISKSSMDKQEESLNNAITRDIAQCYAVEGVYPPSLEYIKNHYGLTYDEDLFFVDYRAIAGNIHPDVTIIRTDEE